MIRFFAGKISITFRQTESLFMSEGKAVYLPILIALAQLLDAAIRYLAFSRKVTEKATRKLFLYSSLWCVASVFVYEIFFAKFFVDASTYKLVLFIGWIPYFIIGAKIIPWGLPQHFFVFGMGVMCSLIQHTIGAFFVLSFVNLSESELIFIEAATYLALFVIFLPVCGYFFVKLLPSREFFNLRPQGIYIALLPLIICSAHLIRLADDVLIHSWAERLSRFYLPIVFFFFYRYILNAAKNFYELQRLERNQTRLEEQLTALKEYDSLMTENSKKISVMRHDLRHNYNLINTLLESGDVDKALEHIRNRKEGLP